uniref:Multidrug resistance-associated protein 4 n=1 Tax=Scophthalmus maximus TaxID=52904 RepID=A0A8D3BPU4_SCOMX
VETAPPAAVTTPLSHTNNVCVCVCVCVWLYPLLQLGHKRKLEESDMYRVLPEDRSDVLGETLQRLWEREVRNATKDLRKPKLTRVLIRCFGKPFAVAGLFAFLLTIKVVQPLLLGKIIMYFENYDPDDRTSLYMVSGYGAAMSLSAFGLMILQLLYYYHVQRIGMKIRVAMCHMIYTKALGLSSEAMGQTTTGQIVNLLSNDVYRLDEVTLNLHYLWLGPLQTMGIIFFLWSEIGLSCLAGVAAVALMLPVQTWFGKLFGIFRSKTAVLSDDRIRIMNEVVSGIRIIKMYAWEKPFSALVTEVRRKEISQILKSSFLRGLNMAAFFASSKVIVFITFAVYALLGNAITASRVFVTVSLYGTVKMTVTLLIPLAVEKLSETVVSIHRIKNFLLLKEVDRNTSGIPLDEKNPNCIEMKKLTCYWDKSLDAPSLQNVSVNVKSHKLLTVIGPVGAGKSSLLSAILRELPLDTGTLQVKGQLTYASQQPWLFPGTIRSNILFGRELNSTKYEEVIRACALKRDLELLPDGDRTLIGDRGATLSGGQKARINLARSVYQDADIYLLDDPLSAVDAEVGKHLFEHTDALLFFTIRCICGLLKNKTRVLVTHQLQHLRTNDHILILKEVCVDEDHFLCNMVEETREEGDVSGSIYLQYFTGGRNPLALLAIVVLIMIPSLLLGLTAAAVVFGYARSLVIFHGLVRSAQTLHDSMFSAVLRAPVAFFDVNPIGRILNRFSKDISQMDSMLPITFVDFYQFFLLITGVVAVAAAVIPHILIPIVPLFLVFLYLRRFYLSTSRDIKRLESTTRSPVLSHLSSSLQGLWTIRVFGAEGRLKRDFDAHQDLHSEAWFLFLMTSRWFALCLDSLCSVFITFTTFACIFLRDGLGAGQVGLVLTYAVTLLGNFQWTVRQSAEVENMMTSVERVVEYTQLKSEASWETQKRPPPDWPSRGMVMFKRVNFSYGSDGPQVLKDISITFQPNEKVGVVGRTGAGKSSLVSALFRLGEPEGEIYIDGVLTSEIGLHDLRQKMSIIPQDPVLFTDTVRKNLDPFNQHTDEDLWTALEEVQLRPVVEELPGRLETVLAESGSNFSVGQRQLVCLARAILRKNRVLIIDEATANVDPRTDKLIQRTIRDKFRECTVLTIAHRLNTVIDSDRILVLDSGTIQELDRPFTLLQNKDGALYKMVQQMGPTEAAALLEAARQVSWRRGVPGVLIPKRSPH